MVVQSGYDWDGDDVAGPLHGASLGRIAAQGEVRADHIVIAARPSHP